MASTELKVHDETYTVTLMGLMPKVGKNGDFYDVQVQRPGRQFPETFKCWDVGQLQHLIGKPEGEHTFIFHPERVKDGKSDNGEWGSYWWAIVGEAEASDPESRPPVEDHHSKAEDMPVEDTTPRPPARRDATGRSIEKQQSLIQAVAGANAAMSTGRPFVEEGGESQSIVKYVDAVRILYREYAKLLGEDI